MHTIHTIISPTALNTDAGRQPFTSTLINTPPHIHPADPFLEPFGGENTPVTWQLPELQQDDEDDDLVILGTIPAMVVGNAQTPTIRTDNAGLKRVWNAAKGVFKNKNKTLACNNDGSDDNDDNDDNDKDPFVIVFHQTPERPTRRLTRPPSVQRETKKAEMCNTESVLSIVRRRHPAPAQCPTTTTRLTSLSPAVQRKTKNDNDETARIVRTPCAARIQTRKNMTGDVCRTPNRPNTLASPPLVRRVTRKVVLGDAVAMEEMREAAKVTVKKLQTVY